MILSGNDVFSHVCLGANDLAGSTKFYDAALGALGIKNLGPMGETVVLYGKDKPALLVLKPANGQPATHANGGTTGFIGPDKAAVDAFHAAGIANGGSDEGAPGPRGLPGSYWAYLRDPAGNKIFCLRLRLIGHIDMEQISANRSYGGVQAIYAHQSAATGTPMTFSVFVPEHEPGAKLPVVWYLSGLTCTHANVTEKGEFRRACAELGLIFVAPDTSPRGEGVPDDPAGAYDFGLGAGFYVDATQEPFARNYRMWTYVTSELPALVASSFPVDESRQAIMGHSMGGHGALTVALRNPERFRSVSAFSPIVAPGQVPWGQKALGGYLGPDRNSWRAHDAVALIEDGARVSEILVDQGDADNFLAEQLRPELLAAACERAGIPLTLRLRPGYDHSYYFISTFMEDHLRWHATRLG